MPQYHGDYDDEDNHDRQDLHDHQPRPSGDHEETTRTSTRTRRPLKTASRPREASVRPQPGPPAARRPPRDHNQSSRRARTMTPTNDTNQDTTAKLLPAHADIEAQGTTASCKYWRDSGARPKRLQQALAASKALPNAFYHVLVIFRRTAKEEEEEQGKTKRGTRLQLATLVSHLLGEVLSSIEPQYIDDFAKGVFDGLCLQPPQPEWQCRRRWRNGSLGFVHWASRYGYEHRRHEGEQHMNINNCFTFVFVKATEEAARSIPTSPTVCRVCLQDFENKESLEQHMRTPALPVGDASAHHCSVCRRAFGSSRALDQHMKSCQKPAKPLKESSGYSEVLREGFSGNVVRMDVPITSEAGLRLSHLARQSDKLRRLLPSKAAVKRAIGRGELVLNGEHVEETRILKAGDLVTLCLDRVREALDATTARARNVKMVLPRESPTAPGDGWQVLRSVCPDGVVVVWKPTGMRSLGFHAGTLQSSLPLLPELAALGASRFQPFSRLEIGCCGLSLVPVTDEVQQLLTGGLAAGRVVHTFRAILHGSIGKPGTTLTLTGQESGGREEASDSEEHDSVEQAPIAKADNIVVCHVVDVQHEETSIVDLQVVGAGRCCGALCHLMRRLASVELRAQMMQHSADGKDSLSWATGLPGELCHNEVRFSFTAKENALMIQEVPRLARGSFRLNASEFRPPTRTAENSSTYESAGRDQVLSKVTVRSSFYQGTDAFQHL
ncbi:unnamed protein product [Symbiodinium sp. KB8]|nr:unnamed protein product [Symbiodinium sp. KB8]